MGIVSLGSRQSGDDASKVPYQPMWDTKCVSMSAPRMGVPMQYNAVCGSCSHPGQASALAVMTRKMRH